MKTILNIFIAIAIALVLTGLSACKKDATSNETEVTGTVMEYGSNKPIAGATVILSRADKDAFLFQAYTTYKTAVSDANGKYSFAFLYEDAYKYLVTATNATHSPSEHYSIKRGKNNVNIFQYAPGYLKLHIKNVNPFDANDHLGITGLTGSPMQLYGTSVDTTFTGSVNGNTSVPIYWGVQKNSITKNFSGSAYCPAFDTTLFTINY